jgi:uncharacterized membrane protein
MVLKKIGNNIFMLEPSKPYILKIIKDLYEKGEINEKTFDKIMKKEMETK